MFAFVRAAAAAAAFSALAAAQGTPYLVADLTTQPAAPVFAIDAGAVAGSFSIALHSTSTEFRIWRTDGTTAGTSLLRSAPILSSTAVIQPLPPVARNGLVFFAGPSDDGLDTLWVSDGTAAGTLAIGGVGRAPRSLAVDLTLATTRVWFSASDAANGRELWRSDGTVAGTVRVTQLRAGSLDGMPAHDRVIAPLPSGVFLAGDNGTSGVELFRIVGTFPPVLYANLASGSASSDPREFAWSGDYLMFAADGAGGTEPYCVAQSALQTIDVYPGPTSSFATPSSIVAYQPFLTQPFFYFAANGNTGNGTELWRYNPFSQVLTEIDVVPGSAGSVAQPRFVLGSRVICTRPGSGSSNYVFAVNGGGTTVTALLSDADFPFVASTSPAQMAVRAASIGGPALWRSDGTATGTVFVSLASSVELGTLLPAGSGCVLGDGSRLGTTGAPSPLALPNPPLNGGSTISSMAAMVGGGVLFAKNGEVWRSDGTAAGTMSLFPGPNPPLLWSFSLTSNSPGGLFQNRHWFVAKTPATGSSFLFALYSTDGTPAGTMHVGDLTTQLAGFDWGSVVVANRLLVSAPYGVFGSQLFGTDGTTVQPLAVLTGRPCVLGNYAVFVSGNNPAVGFELWRTDGTVAGTSLVKDMQPGSGSGMLGGALSIAPLNATTALLVGDSGAGEQVWRTSGTAATTTVVSTFAASPSPDIELLASTGTGRVLLAATTASGRDLWSSNGTAAGTVMLVDDAGNDLKLLGECNGAWLFTNRGPGVFGAGRLYRTNGSVATTSLVATLPVGEISDVDENALLDSYLVPAPEVRLFRVGNVVFRTDGTTAGTTSFGPMPTIQWGARQQLAPPGADVAVFSGGDAGGFELWRSGGPSGFTVKHAELNPGPASSSPSEFVHSGGLVFFVADDGQHGRELWAMPAMPTVIPYGTACPGTGGRFPSLVATSPPRLGGAFATELRGGLASSIALRSLGFTGFEIPLGGGCSALNDALVLDAFGLDGLGIGTPPSTTIPLTTALAGVSVFAQGAVLDPLGAFGSLLSMTAGLRAIVGP